MVYADALKIVSSNNVELFRHLGAAHLKRAGIEHRVGSDAAEIRQLVAKESPNLVILDAVLPDGSGYDLCREIKDDPKLKGTHVILIQQAVMSADQVAQTAASGCDDLLALPVHADDFYCHLAQVTGVSLRSDNRVAVEMNVILERSGRQIDGVVSNVSNHGLGFQLEHALELGPIDVTVLHADNRYEGIKGDVVWCHGNQRGFAVGLRFVEIPTTARALLARLSLYKISDYPDGEGLTIAMQGSFDERTDFRPLGAKLESAKHLDFMMQGVSYLSSSGVRLWCVFLAGLSETTTYSFRNCSVAFASQAAMVPMTIGRGEVLSAQAPYYCGTCDREETRLIESVLVRQSDGSLAAPPVHCHVCRNPLEFDDLPARYFAFLMN